ncbi:hypothetical protein F0L74_11775 [Chitinophaga agrisoli]|uniref:Lipoprotein n=1 Tax=Chitinophaga agrisoli TaxID=2607653 RepID=A0A5B2VY62_9BACT|nr:hypothetical protein [Chitinophaga agrisoli]KAA2243187.1 hypothetical protein F0L74_11775 [Chitinophaga agrisoli]
MKYRICLITSLWLIGCVQVGPTKTATNAVSTKPTDSLLKVKEQMQDSAHVRKDIFEEKKDTVGTLDSSISGIYLSDPKSVLNAIGPIDPVVIPGECECATVYNRDKSQVMILYPAYGGAKYEYDIYNVKYSSSFNRRDSSSFLDVTEFETEKGVKLGMSESEFLNIYRDKKWEISEKGIEKKYTFHNQYETYLAIYTFSHGILVEFRIGYDNS